MIYGHIVGWQTVHPDAWQPPINGHWLGGEVVHVIFCEQLPVPNIEEIFVLEWRCQGGLEGTTKVLGEGPEQDLVSGRGTVLRQVDQ